eukprot:s518_g6.t1
MFTCPSPQPPRSKKLGLKLIRICVADFYPFPREASRRLTTYCFIDGSLEVKLPTIWTDGKAKQRLAKAAGAEPAGQMRGVALGDIDLHFVWQAWHLVTWTFTLCGRRATYCTQLALVTRLGFGGAASLCVAGVALGDIDLYFVWQAWLLVTSTFTLCGRRGTYGTQLALVTRLGAGGAASLCVAGVALGDIDLHFVWQAWHLVTSTFTLSGRRGTYGTSLCVAGVALGDIDLHFVWQAWHLVTWTFTLCVADIDLHFVWQAWHLVTWTFTLCGRSGTCGTQLAPVTRLGFRGAASLCVAGVALGDMDLHFVWLRTVNHCTWK